MSEQRPRPRPRPRAKATASTSASATSSGTAVPLAINENDIDAMFTKNTNRTVDTWRNIDQLNRETKKPQPVDSGSDSDSGSDAEQSGSPRRRKAGKRRRPAATDTDKSMPKWQREYKRLMSEAHSDASDSDDIEILDSIEAGGIAGAAAKKRKRTGTDAQERSRSRSLTPPPELPQFAIQNARRLVRDALDRSIPGQHASSDDGNNDDGSGANLSGDAVAETSLSLDEIDDPELVRIVREVHMRAASAAPLNDDLEDTVNIRVRWQTRERERAPMQLDYQVKRHDNFREMFEALADDQGVLSKNLVVTYNGSRIYATVTPIALKIYGSAEFVACDVATYAYFEANRHEEGATALFGYISPPSPPATSPPVADNDVIDITSLTSETEPDDDGDKDEGTSGPGGGGGGGDTFKIVLRSALVKHDITLTVRPTTTCGNVVKAYLQKAGLAVQYPGAGGPPPSASAPPKKRAKNTPKDPRVAIDGDRMDNATEIGEADLDDGDVVDIVGL